MATPMVLRRLFGFASTPTAKTAKKKDAQIAPERAEQEADDYRPRFDKSPDAGFSTPPPPRPCRPWRGFREVRVGGRGGAAAERFSSPVVYLCRRCFEKRIPGCEWREEGGVVELSCSADEFRMVEGWIESRCRHGRRALTWGCFRGAV